MCRLYVRDQVLPQPQASSPQVQPQTRRGAQLRRQPASGCGRHSLRSLPPRQARPTKRTTWTQERQAGRWHAAGFSPDVAHHAGPDARFPRNDVPILAHATPGITQWSGQPSGWAGSQVQHPHAGAAWVWRQVGRADVTTARFPAQLWIYQVQLVQLCGWESGATDQPCEYLTSSYLQLRNNLQHNFYDILFIPKPNPMM